MFKSSASQTICGEGPVCLIILHFQFTGELHKPRSEPAFHPVGMWTCGFDHGAQNCVNVSHNHHNKACRERTFHSVIKKIVLQLSVFVWEIPVSAVIRKHIIQQTH